MRVRIQKPTFRFEFDGAPAVWNDLLRQFVGGPAAPPDPPPAVAPAMPAVVTAPGAAAPAGIPVPGAVPATAPIVRTFVPPVAPPAASGRFTDRGAERPNVRTWIPPREPKRREDDYEGVAQDEGPAGEARDERTPWRRRGGPEPEIRIEPSNDALTLYSRLGALDSRRAEKDAVLAAVWFVGHDEREVHEKEAEKHLAEHGGPDDVKIRPNFLKHINRTKYFEAGTQPGFVRLTRKGREQIRLLCGV